MQAILENMQAEATELVDAAARMLGALDPMILAMILPLLLLAFVACSIRAAAGN